MYKMTSRERMLNMISHRPTDHIPLYLRFWDVDLSSDVDNIPFEWRDQIRRVENTLALGLDDILLLQPPLGYVEEYIPEKLPGLRTHVELLSSPGEDSLQLKKVYHTPEGPLQVIIKMNADWPYGQEIPLFNDYNVPRFIEPLIKTKEDLPKLKYLLASPDAEALQAFKAEAAQLRQERDRLQVMLEGGWTALGDAAIWLCGMERILYAQLLEPDFVEALLDVIFEWEMKRIDQLLEEEIDVLTHMAWYEGSDFWTPKVYRKMLKPRLARMNAKAHSKGVKFRYLISKGWKPIRHDLVEIGVDCLTNIDPVQDKIDLREMKEDIGSSISLIGGINSSVMIDQWSDEQIRQAVENAVDILSPGGGFALFPVDAVFTSQPWEKVQVIIDHWKKRCL